jgi:hypothetical protein
VPCTPLSVPVEDLGSRAAALARTHYRLAVDDSGDREYSANGAYGPPGTGRSRYFVYGGVLVLSDRVRATEDAIKSIKDEYFRTSSVEVKSHWLRHPFHRQNRYLTPYGLTEQELDRFVGAYYRFLAKSDVRFIATVADKHHMRQKYGDRAWAPQTIAYETLPACRTGREARRRCVCAHGSCNGQLRGAAGIRGLDSDAPSDVAPTRVDNRSSRFVRLSIRVREVRGLSNFRTGSGG